MYRYLLNISYIGTRFRGVQKLKSIPFKQVQDVNRETVQGALELAINSLKDVQCSEPQISSRTDTGVHAFHSTVHVDLQPKNGKPYDTNSLTMLLNRYLHRCQLDVRVLSSKLVKSTFHCRYDAISRTYLYRLAVSTSDSVHPPLLSFIPIEEFHRCYFITNPTFDIDLAREAASLIKGVHDFRSFMSTGSNSDHKSAKRQITHLEITPGRPFYIQPYDQYPKESISRPLDYQFWDITCSARSFLYRQIRRTVGVIVAVAQGKLTLRDVKTLLQVPSKHTWDPRAVPVPPQGLFLVKVEYKPEDLVHNE